MRRLALVLVIVVALLLAGCNTARGGGWIDSALTEGGKATFGFKFVCKEGEASGQLQYNDHGDWNGVHVRFHAVVDPTTSICGGAIGTGIFTGTYTPQPKKAGPGGVFTVGVVDGGEPGPSSDDLFAIQLTDGVFNGYTNSGSLGGGNIQVWDE
jgi:hypothetical protein